MPTDRIPAVAPPMAEVADPPIVESDDRIERRVLVVDDDKSVLRLFERFLSSTPWKVTTSTTAEAGLQRLVEQGFDVVVSDLTLPNMTGLEMLEHVKNEDADRPFILVTGFATVESAVEAMKKGAFDYLTKPIDRDKLLVTMQRAMRQADLVRELHALRSAVSDRYAFGDIVGRSKAMHEVFYLSERVARTASTILVQGESGTGKELIAKAIHFNSPRRDKPFVAVNCGVLNDNLLESELFGHVKGAFTGAHASRKGLFEEAHGGTLFLDEIGDVTPAMQVKLLRVLQEREIKPVGSNESRKVDVRVIAATHRNLREMVAAGEFREDLFYRVAVITIDVPPLRERVDDIPRLAAHFINHFCKLQGMAPRTISPDALTLLMNHQWPGNVRELENVIERAVYIGTTAQIQPADLPGEFHKRPDLPGFAMGDLNGTLKEAREEALALVEEQVIRKVLHECEGNKVRAARRLGISRGSLYNKLARYGIND
ncbi:MAG: sigma-54-dependent transcriptional regulator [Planctomycetota bacterium]